MTVMVTMHDDNKHTNIHMMTLFAGPYIAGARRGKLPLPGKLNVFFLT